MGFRLVPTSVTLNDLKQHNGRYFALFYRLGSLGANYITMITVVEDRPILSICNKNVVQRI